MTSSGRPNSNSAADRSSIARARSSTSRATSAAANSSLANSAYGEPRHNPSASSNTPSATSGRSGDPSPTRTSSSKRNASTSPLATRSRYPGGRVSRRSVTERRAQPRQQGLEPVRRSPRRLVTPQHVDETITRDHLVRVDHQHREQTALLRASQPHPLAVAHDLQRPQHTQRRRYPVVHRSSNPTHTQDVAALEP